MLSKMHDQIINIFNDDILGKGIDEFAEMLGDYAHMLARLGQSQNQMAALLFDKFSDLNAKLLGEAINYKGAGSVENVSYIARIPGETMVIFADRANLNKKDLSDLLGEKILTVKPKEDFVQTLRIILGGDFDIDSYPLDFTKDNDETNCTYALFPKQKVSATNFKIAQQITDVPIIVR